MNRFTKNDINRFSIKTRRVQSGCLEWQGAKFHNGYGVFRFRDKNLRAHRVAYELDNGPIVNGAFICHSCDNPCCVEITHLFIGDALINAADMMAKRRNNPGHGRNNRRGESHPNSILTENSVRRIRIIGNAVLQKEMAVWFKCSRTHISAILRRHLWKHLL